MTSQRTADPASTADAAAAGPGPLVGLLVAATFVVILNETLMGVAIPQLMRDLHIPASSAQWLTTAFLLTCAVVIPVTGWLLQRLQVRTVFLLAMSLFSTGTLLAVLASGFPALLLARVVQASGTAVMSPLLMTTVLTVVPVERRGRTMGTISIVISVAPAIGPTVSGLVLHSLTWRWMFVIVLPIALLALAVGARLVRGVTTPGRPYLDALSVPLSALAFAGLVYGLSSVGAAAQGQRTGPLWLPLTVGALALVGFVRRQLQLRERALLDLRTFADRTFTVGVLLVAVAMMAMFGTLILLPIYLQDVLGLSTLQTGLLLLPGGAALGVLGPVVGRVYDRVGPRPLVLPGIVVVGAALLGMTRLDAGSSPATVAVLYAVMATGLGVVFTPLMTASLGSVPPQRYSHGSAILGTVQQVAGGAGTALFVTVLARRGADAARAGADVVHATSAGVHAALVCGAVISVAAVVVALFVRGAKPDAADHGAPQVDAADEPDAEPALADA